MELGEISFPRVSLVVYVFRAAFQVHFLDCSHRLRSTKSWPNGCDSLVSLFFSYASEGDSIFVDSSLRNRPFSSRVNRNLGIHLRDKFHDVIEFSCDFREQRLGIYRETGPGPPDRFHRFFTLNYAFNLVEGDILAAMMRCMALVLNSMALSFGGGGGMHVAVWHIVSQMRAYTWSRCYLLRIVLKLVFNQIQYQIPGMKYHTKWS